MEIDFRTRLVATLRALKPVLDVPGVMVAGFEVPNLLQPEAASTLFVSQDVDLAIPVNSRDEVKRRLASVHELSASLEDPAVWVPKDPLLIEANFIGVDPSIIDTVDTYALPDPELPLMVFGPLSLLRPGTPVTLDDLAVPVPRVAGLVLEKLLTDRSGEKGDRDLLVVLGLLLVSKESDLDEAVSLYVGLPDELRKHIRDNLGILALVPGVEGMPDPGPHRAPIRNLLRQFESQEVST